MKILMVGRMHPMYQPIHFAHAFEERGDTVITIATDLIERRGVMCDHHIFDGMSDNTKIKMQQNLYSYNMLYILSHYKPDLIIIFQSQIIIDFASSYTSVPIYYYAKNSYALTLPRNCKIEGMFYSWPGGEKMFKNHYPWRMNNCRFHKYVPCGWSPDFFKHTNTSFRKYFIGFMGHFSSLDGKNSPDENIKNLYNNRLNYKKFFDVRKIKRVMITHKYDIDVYLNFMNNVDFALNVPANNTDVNERTFHSMGMGCVSLLFDNGNLYKYGFINRVNCLTFKNWNDLDNQIDFIKNHLYLSKIEEIRKNGIKLSRSHTFRKRSDTFMRFITG